MTWSVYYKKIQDETHPKLGRVFEKRLQVIRAVRELFAKPAAIMPQ
jgi:hypothetical protein